MVTGTPNHCPLCAHTCGDTHKAPCLPGHHPSCHLSQLSHTDSGHLGQWVMVFSGCSGVAAHGAASTIKTLNRSQNLPLLAVQPLLTPTGRGERCSSASPTLRDPHPMEGPAAPWRDPHPCEGTPDPTRGLSAPERTCRPMEASPSLWRVLQPHGVTPWPRAGTLSLRKDPQAHKGTPILMERPPSPRRDPQPP